MQKYEVFIRELKYIKNHDYRENFKKLVELLPDYFFEIAASSTAKYHPKFSLGKGGLVRHTKTAVRIAYEMLETKTFGDAFTLREKDLMIIALLLHDGLKEGLIKQAYTTFDHPILMAEFIKEHQCDTNFPKEDIDFLVSVISSHMGEWNTSPFSKVVLPLPTDECSKFVHLCDFLSSRKFLNVNFSENEIID